MYFEVGNCLFRTIGGLFVSFYGGASSGCLRGVGKVLEGSFLRPVLIVFAVFFLR